LTASGHDGQPSAASHSWAALVALSGRCGEIDDESRLLEAAVALLVPALGVGYVEILELLPGGSGLKLRAGAGWGDTHAGQATVDVAFDLHTGYTLASASPVVVEDLSTETRFRGTRPLHDHGIVSGVSLTIEVDGRPFGILGVYTDWPRPFGCEAVLFLEATTGLLGTAIARLRAAAAARESQERCQDLLDSTSDLVQSATPDGRLLSANASWLRALGYTAADVAGLSVLDLLEPQSGGRYVEAMRKALAGEGEQQVKATFLARDGRRVAVEGRLAAWRVDGRPAILRFISRNMTELRGLEAQLLQAQKMEAVGRLAGGIAHDFNNLLTGILGYSNLLLDAFSPGGLLRQGLEAIRVGGERAAALTRQLLAFSRRQVLAPCVLNLNDVISDLDRMLRPLLGDDVEVVRELDPALGPVRVDRGQMEQALLNLAVNARDAMPEGGRFSITTTVVHSDHRHALAHPEMRAGDYVLVSVADTGCGMTEQVKAHVFEPFFTTKEQGKGTGLGLAIVYGIIKQFGGFIDVESSPGQGTLFRIYLPRAREEVVRPGAEEVRPDWLRGKETVLVVEDDAAIRNLLRVILGGHGYAVMEACDGLAALAIGERHPGPIDLLLTDVRMPALNGRGLVDRLAPVRPGVKVIYMSGDVSDQANGAALRDGKVPFLQKPFSPQILLKAVREVLDAGNSMTS